MKIVYAVTLGSWGGVATYLNALIGNQVKRHNKVWLITGTEGDLTKTIKLKYPSVNLILLPTLKRNIHIIDTIKAIFQFRKIIKQINPNIIHVNSTMAGIVGRLGSIGLHHIVIYNAHGWSFEPRLSWKYRVISLVIERFLAHFTTKILCVSNYEYKLANSHHVFTNSNQGVVINNGAPDMSNKFKSNINPHKFIMTMAARFAHQKNQPLLIKSFAKLRNKLPNDIKKNVYLYLLGNGPTFNICKNLVKRLKIHNIIFTGEVNNVLSYYSKSDLVVLITRSEGSPLSLIEAMSVKKPLLASNVCGISELFKNNGICVNNNSILIVNAMKKLIYEKDKLPEMGHNSYNWFLREYNQTEMVNKTNYVYNSLLK